MEVTHQEFVELYKNGKLTVAVVENKAGDFVLSKFGDKYNKPAHKFWTWLGIILLFPAPVALLFINWPLAIPCVIIGYFVHKAARKSATEFVLHNMLEDADFFEYVLLHGGAEIRDKDGQIISSAFLNRMKS